MDKNDIKKKINLIMSLFFQINKRGSDFLLHTGVTSLVLQKYEKEFNTLKEFKKDGEDFVIPRYKLCDVLDACFDHFTEESLMRITRLLDKNDDMRDKITERSVSKRKSKDHKDRKEKEEKEKERVKKERDDRERRERDERERREMAEREEHEKEVREQYEKELREPREKEVREQKKLQYMRDLNYEDSSEKTELLKMVSSIKHQLNQLEKYVNQSL